MKSLVVSDVHKLITLEKQIDSAEAWYVEVGHCLAKMRQLFKSSDAFESHCHKLWGWAKSTVYDKIRAAEIAQQVRGHGPFPRCKEVSLALDSVALKERAQIWGEAIAKFGERPSSGQIATLIEEKIGRPPGALPGERSSKMLDFIEGKLGGDADERLSALQSADDEATSCTPASNEDQQDEHLAACARHLRKARNHAAALSGKAKPLLAILARALTELARLEPSGQYNGTRFLRVCRASSPTR